MTPLELVEHHRGELDKIEQLMLHEPELIESLRQQRAEALAMLTVAEAAAVRIRERWPTAEELEAFWDDCRLLGRRRMSTATKAKAVKWFGGKRYLTIPWGSD